MIRYVLRKLVKTKKFLSFFLLTLLGLLLSYFSPYLNGKFIDFLLLNKHEESVVWFALVVALIGLSSVILSYLAGTVSIKVSSLVSFSILRELVSDFEKKDYEDLRVINSSHTTQRFFSDSSVVTSFVLSNFITFPINLIALLVILMIIFNVYFAFAAGALVLLALYVAIVIGLRRTLYAASYEKKEAESTFYALISSQLENILNIQLFSRFEQSRRVLDQGFSVFFPKVYSYGKLSYALSSIDGIASIVSQSIILVVSGIKIIQGSMTLGDFVMVNSYFSILFGILKGYMNFFKAYQDAKASWARICEVRKGGVIYSQCGSAKPSSVSKIEIRNLNFVIESKQSSPKEIAKNEIAVIENFSCTFDGPATYCVTGSNGCGKSSLLYFIAGIYNAGNKIKYDEAPQWSCSLSHLRGELVAFCPQDLYRPPFNVRELLEYMDVVLDNRKSSRTAVEMPLLHSEVERIMDVQCESLSGGELRKVYLYIALSKQSSVLILDEPTTGIDRFEKAELIAYIHNNPLQQIIIATSHDRELISAVDRTIELS